jgi:hypothetical protein
MTRHASVWGANEDGQLAIAKETAQTGPGRPLFSSKMGLEAASPNSVGTNKS